ncbi:TOPRIM nucleotidyl transferase/hydrolase domain-containing protein [Actinoplanes sp. CA-015351]|uniref:TOPRIM nucleotidyl transferase/hydrolase domain-containing protein n=1 Tax=Actinoplanes sp. CA-015351 TaxID=3239897 RepID=UPI003D98E3BB
MPAANAASLQATADAMSRVASASAVILVEGITDQIALETAAAFHRRDLAAERVVIVPIGGAHAIGRFVRMLPAGMTHVGLCDLREQELFRDALTGFQVCADDLEDELIRAAGPGGVTALFETERDLRSFRAFQKQPAWRGQDLHAQMYRFIRSSSRRNLRYARLLTETASGRGVLPRPLAAILETV